MRLLNTLNQQLVLAITAFFFIGTNTAIGEITLPTAVKLERNISFKKPDGQIIQLKPGIYEVALKGEKELSLDPLGSEGPIVVQAMPAGHELPLEHPIANFVPAPDNNPDTQHLVLWLPEGLALEAVGSYTGVFTRAVEGWGKDDTGMEESLAVTFEKPIYFRTLAGEPKAIQPGTYEVTLLEDGIQLSPTGGKGDALQVKTDSMPGSAAVVMEDFNEDPNLEAILIATADGQSIVTIGSHDGTFPKGIWGAIKKAGKAVGGAAKKVGKTAYKVSKGTVKTVAKVGVGVGKDYVAKYGKKLAGKAYGLGKGVITKACGGGIAGATKCLSLAAAAS